LTAGAHIQSRKDFDEAQAQQEPTPHCTRAVFFHKQSSDSSSVEKAWAAEKCGLDYFGGPLVTEQQLRKRAEKLLREGRMPSLAELSQTVLEARKKYGLKIRRARREAREVVVSRG
jgi:hypothetical protein